MDPQLANYLSNLTDDTAAFLEAFLKLQDRLQEGFDREVEGQIPTVDFSQYGDLDHLTAAKLAMMFASFQDVETTMSANDRAAFANLYGIIR